MSAAPNNAEFEAGVDDQIFENIHDVADDVRSLAVSIREAAFRRDGIMLRIGRAEFRQQAILLLGLIRDLAPIEGELAGADKRKGRAA
jgi:hypothetical protein